MLGALLLVRQQLASALEVLLRGAGARARPGDRTLVGAAAAPTVTSASGEAPAIWKSSKSRKYMYGLGLIARSPR